MLLTIDVGNTNSVLCVFDGKDVVEHWRIATDPLRTADELAVVLRGLLSQSERLAAAGLDGIAVCSTVPSVLHMTRAMRARENEYVPTRSGEPGGETVDSIRDVNPHERAAVP